MKQKDIDRIKENSLDNFLIEFISMNKYHNNKVDDNVISFGVLIHDVKYSFFVKNDNEEVRDHLEEMMFEIQAEIGYHYNLLIEYQVITHIDKYKELLKKKEFQCVFIRPDFNELLNICTLSNEQFEKINYYFNKYN